MSKSLKRVEQHLRSLGLQPDIRLMDETTRSALDAAKSVGVEVDQIVKSVVLRQGETELALLFLTAGSHQVDLAKAEQLVGSSVGMPMPDSFAQKPVLQLVGCRLSATSMNSGHFWTRPYCGSTRFGRPQEHRGMCSK